MEVQINRKEMKRDARLAMRDHKPSIYLITLVFLAITAVLSMLSVKLQFPGLSLLDIAKDYFTEAGNDALLVAGERQSFLASVLDFAISIMVGRSSMVHTFVVMPSLRACAAHVGLLR